MSRTATLLLGLLLFVLLCILCVSCHKPSYEARLEQRALDALSTAGIPADSAVFNGHHGILYLPASLGTRTDDAIATVVNEPGIRNVEVVISPDAATEENDTTEEADSTSDAPPVDPTVAQVDLELSNQSLTLSGTLGSETERTALINQAETTFGADYVRNELEVDADKQPLAWTDPLTSLFEPLRDNLPNGEVEITDSTLTLRGAVESEEEKERIGTLIQESAGSDITVVNALTVSEVQARLNALLLGKTIEFRPSSTQLTASGQSLLDQIADVLMQSSNGQIEIEGHTDNTGNPATNQTLSLQRAESVKAYLVQKGIAETRLGTAGLGLDRPIASNATPAGRARNRRVEFTVLN